MKKFLKAFGTGVLFLLMSLSVACFANAAFYGIIAIADCIGWEAVGLTICSAGLVFLAGFITYCMGVIPLSTIDDLRQKLSKLEDKEND
jgi:hypothetical protein